MKLQHASRHAVGAAEPICSGLRRWEAQPLLSAEWRPPWLHSYCNVGRLKMTGTATVHLNSVVTCCTARSRRRCMCCHRGTLRCPLKAMRRSNSASACTQYRSSKLHLQVAGHGRQATTAAGPTGDPRLATPRRRQDFIVLHKGLSCAQAQSTADDTGGHTLAKKNCWL